MAYSTNSHNSNRIRNLVDDAMVPYANPPVVLRSCEFTAANRTRIVRETMQCYAESHIEWESSEALSAERPTTTRDIT